MTTSQQSMQELWKDSYLASGNEDYLEELYESFLKDAESVSPEWQKYFNQLIKDKTGAPDVPHAEVREQFLQLAQQSARHLLVAGMDDTSDKLQEKVLELISAYRRLGHLKANIDPLNLYKGIYNPTLELNYYGFSELDLQKTVNATAFPSVNKPTATIKEIDQRLRSVYANTIGFEYMYISRAEEVEWIRERIENQWASFKLSKEDKLFLLSKLIAADGLEKYLGVKYVGQKRFSLEGGDCLIPMLETIVNRSSEKGVKEAVIGMAHRGRLNVLANVVGKGISDIFAAFEGTGIPKTHSGDVKYHLGSSSDVKTKFDVMHIALAFNPSHLEIVSPVVQGSVRARQRRRRDTDQKQVLPIQLHGDAAFAGQGVVMETFNMSQARWFTVGGSIHIVINNQIGFTISDVRDARSTIYCTDVAKMLDIPILHVNGNDPEAVYFAALFAVDYRTAFKKDVVIDLVCYRRHGHNEADEPSATQPIMYKVIKALPPPYQLYATKLIGEGVITEEEVKKLVDDYRQALDEHKSIVEVKDQTSYEFAVNWNPFSGKGLEESALTAVPLERIQQLANQLAQLPAGFVVQPQVKKMLDNQKKMTEGEMPLNWGYCEIMAYATLLDEGYPIRLCGQDAARGTFAHRHAILHDQNTDEIYVPLSHLSPDQAQINIVDSLLSENAVLAFEYGYATAEPKFLVIWEAQYGDFANGAQVVIDQFLSSGEQKWGRLCGLVMLLPHGYEDQGPEHSSARLERYLQLCAQDNMQVCVPTTPAQIFHLLRRQMLRACRKPLIVMSPKSMLRNPLAVSAMEDLTQGEFHLMIPEVDTVPADKVVRVVLCYGKLYYELLAKRREMNLENVAILRVEQLYPFPSEMCKTLLAQYVNAKEIIWCQEEPQNQGAWSTIQPYLVDLLSKEQVLRYVGRLASASTAVGYHSVHEQQQKELVTKALTI